MRVNPLGLRVHVIPPPQQTRAIILSSKRANRYLDCGCFCEPRPDQVACAMSGSRAASRGDHTGQQEPPGHQQG